MRKLWPHTLLWFVGGWAAFSIYIQHPGTLNFDEFHYVPAARTILEQGGYPNAEHPPLAKWCIAAGIALGGDQPFGWRLASTVFGALTLVCFFILGYLFLNTLPGAHFTAALVLFNQLLYVQSRIAMLDPIMMGFLSVAWVFLFWALIRSQRPVFFIASGIAFGLACACKWTAAVPLALSFILIRNVTWSLTLIASALGAYFLVFLPLVGFGPHMFPEFFQLQRDAYHAQLRVGTVHPYSSSWYTWPFMIRPIWYAFDRESGGEFVRGVFLVGNPLLMWGGLVALLIPLQRALQQNFKGFALSVLFLGQYFAWAVIPRPLTFYYYYVPCGMILTLITAWAIEVYKPRLKLPVLVFSGALFFYFWPILAAWKIPSNSFTAWMWFRSWI